MVDTTTQTKDPVITTASQVFAAAALLELELTLFDLDNTSSESTIQERVRDVIRAIQCLPQSASLRSFAWAICVAGSSAREDQQTFFDGLLHDTLAYTTPGLTNFGTVLDIISHCWRCRNIEPHKRWTWRDSMESLGICALLV